MGKPIPPYVLRRLEEDARVQAKGHALLAEAVRSMSHLTVPERAEAERLIVLPYGAEDNALRRFVGEHIRMHGKAA